MGWGGHKARGDEQPVSAWPPRAAVKPERDESARALTWAGEAASCCPLGCRGMGTETGSGGGERWHKGHLRPAGQGWDGEESNQEAEA